MDQIQTLEQLLESQLVTFKPQFGEQESSSNLDCGQDYQCCICLKVVATSQNVTKLRCKHSFHTECIMKWLNVQETLYNKLNCPICRCHVLAMDSVNNYSNSWPKLPLSS